MIKFFRAILIILFLLLFSRLFYLTVVQGENFRERADENRIIKEIIPAPRGIIYDRSGHALVTNASYYQFEGREINRDEFLKLAAQGKGDAVKLVYGRKYLFGKSTAHLLGYLSLVTQDEIEMATDKCGQYYLNDLAGRGGVEEEYECWLKGETGQRLVETDIKGNVTREVGRAAAKSGRDLILNIDIQLQEKAFELLSSRKGAIIITNPQNGAVLGLVSSPSFDSNLFTVRRNEEAIEALLHSEEKPFLNRAVSARFPPGSVFKIVTAIAGLEEGKIDSQTKIEDTGVLRVGDFEYSNWYFTQYGKTEGELDLVGAMKRSNDIFFYKVGEFLGVDKLSFWAKKFGLDKVTGIDLPAEAAGIVPSKTKEPWFLGNTYHFAIGQGDLATTPLAINIMTNVIANNGKWCQPRIAKEYQISNVESQKFVTDNCYNLGIKKENIELVKEGMKEACSKGGTGFPFFDFKIKGQSEVVACKTGTAEFGSPDGEQLQTHAWFTAFAPVNNPQVSVTVFLEGGGEGSRDAAPIAKEIMEEYFKQTKN